MAQRRIGVTTKWLYGVTGERKR